MFDWIKGYSLIEVQDETEYDLTDHRFQMDKLDAVATTTRMTALGQYYVEATIRLSEHMVIDIPVPDEESRRLVLEQIAPHYARVHRVRVAGETEVIRMQELRPEAKVMSKHTHTAVLPLIEDIYRHPIVQEQPRQGIRNLLYYTIANDKLTPYNPMERHELDDLQELLTRAFLRSGSGFNMAPVGWTFDANLPQSIALRFYSSFIPVTTVCVDADTAEIVMLQFTNQPIKHPVVITREEFGQTRRVDSFLYYYLSGGLVYVIDLQDQPPIEHWAELKSCTLFRMGADIRFSQFDHASGEQVREGLSLLFDQDTRRTIIETINQFCTQGS